jgi:hypothetical protein
MSAVNERGSSSRGRTSGRSSSKSASATKRKPQTARSRSQSANGAKSKPASGARSKTASGARSNTASGAKTKTRQGANSRQSASPARNRSQSASPSADRQTDTNHSGREGKSSLGVSMVTGAIGVAGGIAGGILLGRNALARNRKVLGVEMPSRIDFGGVTQQIGEAGRQFGKLAGEVRTVREKAEQLAKALS